MAKILIEDREENTRGPFLRGILIRSLQDAGRDARLVIYPGVGRGFDFRPAHVRTLADDLAAQDALERASVFMRKHLAK